MSAISIFKIIYYLLLAALARGAASSATRNYIVVLKSPLSARAVSDHFTWANTVHARSLSVHPRSDNIPVGVTSNFSLDGSTAYTGEFTASVAELLRRSDDVEDIEDDARMVRVSTRQSTASAPPELAPPQAQRFPPTRDRRQDPEVVTQEGAPPHLARLSHLDPGQKTYVYRSRGAGRGMFAYVLDGGVLEEHVEFGGRVVKGKNEYMMRKHKPRDGQGTAIAGLIAGSTTGVVKEATIVDVKIAHKDESLTSKVMKALEWARNDIVEKALVGRAVVVLCHTTADGPNMLLKKLIKVLADAKIPVIVPSGDDGLTIRDSPADSPDAIVVGALNKDRDTVWLDSARERGTTIGSEIHVFAPGVDVNAPWGPFPEDFSVVSGAGYAAAYVAGLALYIMQMQATGPEEGRYSNVQQLKDKISELSIKHRIPYLPEYMRNQIAHNGGEAAHGLL